MAPKADSLVVKHAGGRLLLRATRTLHGIHFGSTAVLRVGNMAIGFAVTLGTTRYLVDSYGVASFAAFAILVSVLATMPFADLGLGAGVVNSTADFRAGKLERHRYLGTLRSITRVLAVVSIGILGVAITIGAFVKWPVLLGLRETNQATNIAAVMVMGAFALSLPVSIGSRIFQGASMTHRATLIAYSGSILQVLTLSLCIGLKVAPPFFALTQALALLGSSLITTLFAFREIGITTRELLGVGRSARLAEEYSFGRSAVPYMITTICVAATLQLQRILLAHVSSTEEVARYAFVSQFTVAVTSVVTLSSLNLWPVYRAMRSDCENSVLRRRLLQDVAAFSAVGATFATVTALTVWAVMPWGFNSRVAASEGLLLAASSVILVWSASRPGIMFLNFPAGFWFQAAWGIPCAVVSVALTLILGSSLGAEGAFLANVLALLFLTLIPNVVRSVQITGSVPKDELSTSRRATPSNVEV